MAHKFGERGLPDGKVQLHYCGIVYHPTYPYAVYMMTEGDNIDELAEVIATVSKEIHDWLDAQE